MAMVTSEVAMAKRGTDEEVERSACMTTRPVRCIDATRDGSSGVSTQTSCAKLYACTRLSSVMGSACATEASASSERARQPAGRAAWVGTSPSCGCSVSSGGGRFTECGSSGSRR
eukprot:scaffold100531_cov29-Tisochrysis_lutea.AAC.5